MWPIMNRMRWEMGPFAELSRLNREASRFFDESRWAVRETPKMEVRGNADEMLVALEAPGMKPDQFEITLNGETLAITGERMPEDVQENDIFYRQERDQSSVARSVRLPYEVDESQITARYEQGVLRIRLPRSEATKPRKIEVQA